MLVNRTALASFRRSRGVASHATRLERTSQPNQRLAAPWAEAAAVRDIWAAVRNVGARPSYESSVNSPCSALTCVNNTLNCSGICLT
jgi:hypothetical protein